MSQDFGKYLYYSTDKAVEIYEKLNQYAIREIVRRLVRTGYLNKAATNIIYKMQEAGMTMQAIIEAVARHSGMTENEVKKAFEDAAIEASREDTETYRHAGIKQNTVLTSEVMKNALKTAILQTNNELRNITRTMAQKSQAIFIEAVDEAYMKVQSGMCTYETAIAEAITEVSKNGLYVKYPSGHRDTIETAVRRALMTGLNQGTMRMKIAKMKEMGQDLLVTSQHIGARTGGNFPYEDHSKWQGKVFSIGGQSHKYPSFTEACGWGKGGGIGGWNCRHHIYAYIEGVSKLPEPIDEEENRRVEELNKKQRRYESSIRAKKRELLGLKEGMETTDSDKLKFELQQQYDRSAYELRELNKNYNDFCADNNLRTWNERKKVTDFQREQSYEARLGADRYKKELLHDEKNIKIPDKFKNAKGIDENIIDKIQSGIDNIKKEYHIELSDILVEKMADEKADIPYMCRYINKDGKHEAQFVLNSAYDFNGFEEIVKKGYKYNYFAGKTISDHIIHEMAHVMTGQHIEDANEFNLFMKEIEKLYVPGISGYSDEMKDGFETIAEAFVRKRNGESIPKEAEELVEKYIERWRIE